MSNDTKDILKKFNVRPLRRLGQNFLIDQSVVAKIVDAANVSQKDLVIEVGPGTGSMTRELAARAGKVTAVEIDRHLIPVLRQELHEFSNVEILNEDIMKTDIKEDIIGRYNSGETCFKPDRVKVVANLPYYITTPVIMKFLEENPGIDTMVFMVQREVAERMAAQPGGKEYGALSVAVQYYSRPEFVLEVPPDCFIPRPEVYSTVIRLNIYDKPPVDLLDEGLFFKVVKASFGQRRKNLVNALYNSGYFKATKDEIKLMLKNIGIDENRRGETLTIMQFADLANLFSQK
jgi:16S rRNA (adenine1518-N6/adenine1519-N6)-dimethyltransferase